MNIPEPTSGNSRTGPARKRAILRALRHFFLWGWVRYHGHLIEHEPHLAAFFPKETVAAVKGVLGSRRKWWYQQDPLLRHRQNDGQVHLPTKKTTHIDHAQKFRLRLLTYNCKTLGYTQARLVEIAEDLHCRNIHVAAIQSTCWKHTEHRTEWTVKNRHGKPLYHCVSWGRSPQRVQTGVMLLLSVTIFDSKNFSWRLDAEGPCQGRIGGLRVVDRQSSRPSDHTFITAYAPQETAPDDEKQNFFTNLQSIVHSLPARTRVWVLGDFNAHVGLDLCSASVGTATPEHSTDNGIHFAHMCLSASLFAINTFHAAGDTWWSPDGFTGHRLDYITAPLTLKRRIKHCSVNQVLGRRWQTSTTPDHWPLEVHVQIPEKCPHPPAKTTSLRWNQHAMCRASRDQNLFLPFLTEANEALTTLQLQPWCVPQDIWTASSKALLLVAQKHFGMRPLQKNPKILPATFDILERRRLTMNIFLTEAAIFQTCPSQSRARWSLRVVVRALQLNRTQEQAKRAIKQDVKDWKSHLTQQLHEAMRSHDAREAWRLSRQLAGRLFKNPRPPPPTRPISRLAWVEHFRKVQLAEESECSLPYSNATSPPEFLAPIFAGEEGCDRLARAAGRMQRGRATPTGALPVELWSLLLQGKDALRPGLTMMPMFEAMQRSGANFAEWCIGYGCPIPKPGGDPTPNGQRVINLLDPLGKVFYKAALDSQPDPPHSHQYGYSAGRSRRDAILQLSTLLERLKRANICTSTNLYDLTKAFDMLCKDSVLADVQQDQLLHPTFKALLADLQQRLHIRLPLHGSQNMQVKLGAGVLQGGGTGPRLFRRVYDRIISGWKENTIPTTDYTTVFYNGGLHDIATAAYADDLARVEAARCLEEVEQSTVVHTQALKEALRPHRLELNLKKSEAMLALRGRGAYAAAKKAFSGTWKGPPLRRTVKYLGAHLQASLSTRIEVTKRIAAARTGFSKFAAFFQNSQVPLGQKKSVFRSVVNEAFLSALEVRTLTASDIERLESARGLLLRRIFGKNGFGATRHETHHRSVPISHLRLQCGLVTIACELRVRRLLWLRAALYSESLGENRLDLAALFGTMQFEQDSPVREDGSLTFSAPSFLRLLHADLQSVLPHWTGFSDGWKTEVLALRRQCFTDLRTAELAVIAAPPDIPVDRVTSREERPPTEPVQSVASPSDLVDELCVLSSGEAAGTLSQVSAEEWLDGVYCGTCAAGPWHGRKSFTQHVLRKHSVRNQLQSNICPLCQREFTQISACRRHVKNQSCGSSVNSHGEAGAVEGLRHKKALAQAPPVHVRPERPADQHGRPSLHVASDGQPNSSSRSSTQASQRRKARNIQPRGASAHPDLPDAHRHEGGEPARPRHPRVRCMELPHLFAAQRERARQSLVDSNASVEGADTNNRTSSSRCTTLDGGRNSSTVSPEGLSIN